MSHRSHQDRHMHNVLKLLEDQLKVISHLSVVKYSMSLYFSLGENKTDLSFV